MTTNVALKSGRKIGNSFHKCPSWLNTLGLPARYIAKYPNPAKKPPCMSTNNPKEKLNFNAVILGP